MNVLTSKEHAEIDSGGERSEQEVEPLAYYGVLRAQREFNRGNQGFGLIVTSVVRDLKTENVRSLLNKDAFALALDGWSFLNRNRSWVLSGWLGGSRINGTPEDLLRVQQSAQHYFQRPDAGYLHLDPTATALGGWAGRFTLNKEKGNVIVNASAGFVSPGFDSNDIGFMTNGDFINGRAIIGYRWFKPGRVFRNWSVTLSTSRSYNFGGDRIEESYSLDSEFELLNYWNIDLGFGYNRPVMDSELSRGGALMLHPASRNVSLLLGSDNRKPWVLFAMGEYNRSDSGGINVNVETQTALETSRCAQPLFRTQLRFPPFLRSLDQQCQ